MTYREWLACCVIAGFWINLEESTKGSDLLETVWKYLHDQMPVESSEVKIVTSRKVWTSDNLRGLLSLAAKRRSEKF